MRVVSAECRQKDIDDGVRLSSYIDFNWHTRQRRHDDITLSPLVIEPTWMSVVLCISTQRAKEAPPLPSDCTRQPTERVMLQEQ